jgi:Tol biopolymer transport system component
MAANADIAYLPSSGFDARRALVQVWEKGATEVVTTDRQAIAPRLSPDGTRVVFSDGADIWSYTLKTDVWLQLTFDQLNDTPIWSPDGKTIVFRSRRDGGVMNIYRQSADGSGATERLTQSARVQWPAALTRDNRTLIVSEAASANNGDILTVALGGDGQSRSFIATPAATWAGGLSPDGRWLVYTSDESGRAEVYVTAFPSGSGRWRISNNGGTEPVWSRSGREVLYRERDRMMTVAIEEGSSFSYARPRLLFEGRYLHCCDGLAFYDAAGDGRGALMLRSEPAYEIRIVRGALARN